MNARITCAITILLSSFQGSAAADYFVEQPTVFPAVPSQGIVVGRVAVVDGRTLWFPARRRLVRLSGIDSCDLVQWSFDPKATHATAPSLAPVPCGALAKAWLKRTIGSRVVRCNVVEDSDFLEPTGLCTVGNHDLALEMLNAGWAKLNASGYGNGRYVDVQQTAIAARYGMWATYVLDMPEWREKAIDRTLGRRPEADINLLGQRKSEISPPFLDARRQPERRDR